MDAIVRIKSSSIREGVGVDNLCLSINGHDVTDTFRTIINRKILQNSSVWFETYLNQVASDIRNGGLQSGSAEPPLVSQLRKLGAEAQMLGNKPIYSGACGKYGIWRYLGRTIDLPLVRMKEITSTLPSLPYPNPNGQSDWLVATCIKALTLDERGGTIAVIRNGEIQIDVDLLFENQLEKPLSDVSAKVKELAKREYNVVEYGAKGDAVTFDDDAIHAALNAAWDNGGGRIVFPPGTYRIKKEIDVTGAKPQVTFEGNGCPNYWEKGKPKDGTWILMDDADCNAFAIWKSGTAVKKMGFIHGHKLPDASDMWEPDDRRFAIVVCASGVVIEDILLYNTNKGIQVGMAGRPAELERPEEPDVAAGGVILNRIKGQPLRVGIAIDFAPDIVTVTDVHFSSYWSGTLGEAGDEKVARFLFQHANAIECRRVDNPMFQKIFALGYCRGMYLVKGPKVGQITSKFKVSQCDFDYCSSGIEVDGEGITGCVGQMSFQGETNGKRGWSICAIAVSGGATDVRVNFESFKLTSTSACIANKDAHLSIDGGNIENWNFKTTVSDGQFPALQGVNGGHIRARNVTFSQNPNVSWPSGKTGGNVDLKE